MVRSELLFIFFWICCFHSITFRAKPSSGSSTFYSMEPIKKINPKFRKWQSNSLDFAWFKLLLRVKGKGTLHKSSLDKALRFFPPIHKFKLSKEHEGKVKQNQKRALGMASREWQLPKSRLTFRSPSHHPKPEKLGAETGNVRGKGRLQQEQGAFKESKSQGTNHRFQSWKGLRTNEVRANRSSLHCCKSSQQN